MDPISLQPSAFSLFYCGPIQGGTVGTGLAAGNYLWERGLRMHHAAYYVLSKSSNGLLVEAFGNEKDS